MVFERLFKKKPDLATLEKLELPDLPPLPAVKKGKQKGKFAAPVPAYLHYISTEKHEHDVKKLEKQLAELQQEITKQQHAHQDMLQRFRTLDDLRREIDSLGKTKFSGIREVEKELHTVKRTQDDLLQLRNDLRGNPFGQLTKDVAGLQTELAMLKKEKKGRDVFAHLTRLESDIALLQQQQKSMGKESIKNELENHIKTLVAQHVFESRYDPKQFRTMKKEVLSFISKAIDAGHSEEKVKDALVARGWPEQLVAAYYAQLYDEKMNE